MQEPTTEDVRIEFGFFMNTPADEPEGVQLRIYGGSKVIAELRFARGVVGDLMAGSGANGRLKVYRQAAR